MVLAAIGATAVIFGNATFKENLTNGHFIDPMTILPYVGMVVMSFVFFVLGRSNPGKMVGLFALVALALTAFSMGSKGEVALWSIIGIGLFNSIMWSNIFSLSIRGLGKDTSQGSSLLVMMIVGGAIMPLIQGALMDSFGVRASLAIVLVGYAYLVYFGFYGARADDPSDDAAGSASAGH
jgi:FHS family L-fucose permease-like MFS transporter